MIPSPVIRPELLSSVLVSTLPMTYTRYGIYCFMYT